MGACPGGDHGRKIIEQLMGQNKPHHHKHKQKWQRGDDIAPRCLWQRACSLHQGSVVRLPKTSPAIKVGHHFAAFLPHITGQEREVLARMNALPGRNLFSNGTGSRGSPAVALPDGEARCSQRFS